MEEGRTLSLVGLYSGVASSAHTAVKNEISEAWRRKGVSKASRGRVDVKKGQGGGKWQLIRLET